MGTKIEPIFKTGFPLASEGWHLFRIVEPRIDTIAPEDRKEKDGVTNDRNFVVRSAIEGGEEDGVDVIEYFANYSKPMGKHKEPGLSRLAGLMIKTEVVPADTDFNTDQMRTEKFDTKFKMALPKRIFGGLIEHTKMKSRDDSSKELIFPNIKEYATAKEYNEIIARLSDKGVQGKSKGSDKGQGEKSAETGVKPPTEAQKDPWA